MRDVVADVGNSRIKWGECAAAGISRVLALALDDPDAWAARWDEWRVGTDSRWTLAGTHPAARDRFAQWLRRRGAEVRIIDHCQQIPIRVRVDHPEQVGIDRLLNAVAVLPKGIPAIVIDAGSAVTVDLIDGEGAFRGGAIFPGFRLMAKALNDYTARLPLITSFADSTLPATNTTAAISTGIANAVAGAIDRIVDGLRGRFGPARIWLTGGDAERLKDLECQPEVVGPYLTLEGIRLAAPYDS